MLLLMMLCLPLNLCLVCFNFRISNAAGGGSRMNSVNVEPHVAPRDTSLAASGNNVIAPANQLQGSFGLGAHQAHPSEVFLQDANSV